MSNNTQETTPSNPMPSIRFGFRLLLVLLGAALFSTLASVSGESPFATEAERHVVRKLDIFSINGDIYLRRFMEADLPAIARLAVDKRQQLPEGHCHAWMTFYEDEFSQARYFTVPRGDLLGLVGLKNEVSSLPAESWSVTRDASEDIGRWPISSGDPSFLYVAELVDGVLHIAIVNDIELFATMPDISNAPALDPLDRERREFARRLIEKAYGDRMCGSAH